MKQIFSGKIELAYTAVHYTGLEDKFEKITIILLFYLILFLSFVKFTSCNIFLNIFPAVWEYNFAWKTIDSCVSSVATAIVEALKTCHFFSWMCFYVWREKLRVVVKPTYYFCQLTNSTSCITGKPQLLKPEDAWAVSTRSWTS